jgi:hypothetical protein
MPLKSEICDAYEHYWCNCPDPMNARIAVGTRDGPSRDGARAIDSGEWDSGGVSDSSGVLRVGGLVSEVGERVEIVGDGGARQRLVSPWLDGN